MVRTDLFLKCKMIGFVLFFCLGIHVLQAQNIPLPLRHFLDKPFVRGASVSLMVKDVRSGAVLYEYDSRRRMTPASVMKTVTTASALEMLGGDFRFETSVLYDGEIREGVLNGNLYIYGSGDPTLNSSELKSPQDSILSLWATAVQKAGIRQVRGSVIADESVFDTEGVSMKWMREDLGSEYGQGSYGLNIFDNRYDLYLENGAVDTKPSIKHTDPDMPDIVFHNYLTTRPVSKDSCFIAGSPFSNERYMYGVVPARRSHFKLTGDIPDPALYSAQYVHAFFQQKGIQIKGAPSCHRLLSESGKWPYTRRKKLITTYSPPLEEIVQILSFTSHNLYADALFKTLGLQDSSSSREVVSSFGKGARVIHRHWHQKGLDVSSLRMFDGSGLAITDKVTTAFLCDLYVYMATRSDASEAFFASLPRAGIDGTVRNMMKGSDLHGKARLKSGSMSRVLCYAGYVDKDGKRYAVALLVNDFAGKSRQMKASIEVLLLSLFGKT